MQVHALVEYETADAAEKAVSSLISHLMAHLIPSI